MRVASFNMLHGRSLSDDDVDIDRLVAACASLDADVLALQEVDRAQERSGGFDLTKAIAAELGSEHWRFEPALYGTPGESWRAAADGDDPTGVEPAYGVALVSRFPIRRWHVVRLAPLRNSLPWVVPAVRRVVRVDDEPRVGLIASVEAPSGQVTVASAHLSYVPGWNAHQLRQLVRVMRRRFAPPYLLLGDLNLPGRWPARVTGWRSLVRERTFPAQHPTVQLDHVLGAGALPAVSAAGAELLPISDHRAVVVDLVDSAV